MKFKTLYDGEKAVVVDRNGKKTFFSGPRRVFLFLEKFEKLQSYVADEKHYLTIKYINGKVVHKKGPVQEWFNRFEHELIQVKELYKLNQSETIVVYSRDTDTTKVKRRLCVGPCLYMPDSNEWIHEFNWHIQDNKQIGHLIKNEDLKFEILTNKPDFFHYYVKEVRTLDDTLLTVKLMLIFKLVDIFTMLDKTQDPISDFINAICADVVSYVGKLTFTEFVKNGAQSLNSIETYEQLQNRAERTGYQIDSIIYNGFTSSDALQAIQDSAIQARTKLRLDTEIAEQNNRLIDLRLQSQNQCIELEKQLNKLKVEFEQKIIENTVEFNMTQSKSAHEIDMEIKEVERTQQIEINKKRKDIEEDYLKKLSDLGVDINKYQMQSAKSKNKLDKLYEML